jgi:hypothetical protein
VPAGCGAATRERDAAAGAAGQRRPPLPELRAPKLGFVLRQRAGSAVEPRRLCGQHSAATPAPRHGRGAEGDVAVVVGPRPLRRQRGAARGGRRAKDSPQTAATASRRGRRLKGECVEKGFERPRVQQRKITQYSLASYFCLF